MRGFLAFLATVIVGAAVGVGLVLLLEAVQG